MLSEKDVLASLFYAWCRTDLSVLDKTYYDDNEDYLDACPEKAEGWSDGAFPLKTKMKWDTRAAVTMPMIASLPPCA